MVVREFAMDFRPRRTDFATDFIAFFVLTMLSPKEKNRFFATGFETL